MRGLGLFMTFLGVLPSIVVALGCVVFAVRSRSCLSIALVVAAALHALMTIASGLMRTVVYPWMARSGLGYETVTALQVSSDLAVVAAGVVFGVLLAVVLFRSATSAGYANAALVSIAEPPVTPEESK